MKWLKSLFGGQPPTPPSPPIAPEPTPPPEFPFPVTAVPGKDAVKEWQRLQLAWRAEGASAVMLGSANHLSGLATAMQHNKQTPEQILAAARLTSHTDFFSERTREAEEWEHETDEGEWPAITEPMSLGAHNEVLSRKPVPTVYIACIPTPRSWEIPAYLEYGGWNSCPTAEQQVAVLKHWHERHGIELYAIVDAVLECHVTRPPRTREDALALAHEQYLFCSDIVDQGTGTIADLGGALINSPAWYFWWD